MGADAADSRISKHVLAWVSCQTDVYFRTHSRMLITAIHARTTLNLGKMFLSQCRNDSILGNMFCTPSKSFKYLTNITFALLLRSTTVQDFVVWQFWNFQASHTYTRTLSSIYISHMPAGAWILTLSVAVCPVHWLQFIILKLILMCRVDGYLFICSAVHVYCCCLCFFGTLYPSAGKQLLLRWNLLCFVPAWLGNSCEYSRLMVIKSYVWFFGYSSSHILEGEKFFNVIFSLREREKIN